MNRLLSSLLSGILFLLISCNSSTDKAESESLVLTADTLELAEQKMQTFIDSGLYAGIVVRTIIDNKVAHSASFGYSDLEAMTPIEEDGIFRVYSMTKPIVAAGIMTLFDEGKLKLDDPVYNYIPAFKDTKVYTPGEEGFTLEDQETPMTIRHLLTHSSGLVYGFNPTFYVDSIYLADGMLFSTEPLSIAIEALASFPLACQPGTKYNYSLSLDVAGYIIEVISGKTLDVFMEERLFGPLKMDDTGFYVPEEKHDRLVSMYTRDGGVDIMLYDDMTGQGIGESFKKSPVNLSGGAGLVSTIGDYGRYAQMLLNGGELDGVRVLEESTVDLIMSDQLPEAVNYGGENMGYGLGGYVNKVNGRYGWSGAASTTFTVYPENNMIVMGFSQVFWSDPSFSNTYRYYINQALPE